jgi:uncharacterized membrane protein YhaH (DUF805 family)
MTPTRSFSSSGGSAIDNWTSDDFLLSFDGRFNRIKVWYALYAGVTTCTVRLVVLVFWVFILDAIFGTRVTSVHLDIYDIFDDPPSFPFRVTFGGSGLAWLVSLLFYIGATPSLVFAIQFPAAAAVKRLHDRNKSGWWIMPFLGAPILLGKVSDWLGDSYAADVLMLVMIALSLWGFSETLCLRGPAGPTDLVQTRWRRSIAPRVQLRIGSSCASRNMFGGVPVRRPAHESSPPAGPHVKRRHD